MKLTFTILPCASLAFALPNGTPPPKSSCSSITSYTANFDDYPTSPVSFAIPTPYKGLYFQGFETTTPDAMLATVVPHSPPSFAGTNAQFETLQGSAEWTVLYPNSKVKSFSLESFFFGCVLAEQNGEVATPMACNVAVTAFKKGDNTAQAVQVGAQGFSYDPTTSLGPQQAAFDTFSDAFKDIQYVLLQWTPADSTIAVSQPDFSLAVDDVKYTVCNGS